MPDCPTVCAILLSLCAVAARADDLPEFGVATEPGKVVISVGGQAVATYVFADPETPRPYFAHVSAPGGVQATRNHPPVEGADRTDHAAYHPGIWMAFGDLGGADVWRNKGRVVHEAFVEAPAVQAGRAAFTVRNRYEHPDGTLVCRELCRYTLLVRPSGYLLLWDSAFSADDPFYFGDQEEMGLGIRVATPMAVESGGTILDAKGRKNGRAVWGNASDWCDYRGAIDGRRVGLTIFCHPDNFRPSWFHARDYGLLVANPFGQRAFGKGEASKVVVEPGDTLRLRYGLLLHAGTEGSRPDLDAAYADFVELAGADPILRTDCPGSL
jgi:hypothetical protein